MPAVKTELLPAHKAVIKSLLCCHPLFKQSPPCPLKASHPCAGLSSEKRAKLLAATSLRCLRSEAQCLMSAGTHVPFLVASAPNLSTRDKSSVFWHNGDSDLMPPQVYGDFGLKTGICTLNTAFEKPVDPSIPRSWMNGFQWHTSLGAAASTSVRGCDPSRASAPVPPQLALHLPQLVWASKWNSEWQATPVSQLFSTPRYS